MVCYSLNGVETEEFQKYVDSMQSKLESYDTNLTSNQEQFDRMYQNLTELVQTNSPTPNTTAPTPNTIPPLAVPTQPPCSPLDFKYVKGHCSDPNTALNSCASSQGINRAQITFLLIGMMNLFSTQIQKFQLFQSRLNENKVF